jgi:two-component sensor histidine kinase
LTHSSGIQKINLDQFERQVGVPDVTIERVTVNDSVQTSFPNGIDLSPNQNKVKFELAARTLKYKNELLYKYRLVPIDNQWQYNKFEENSIEYKSLPSGEYEFEYATVFRGVESEVKSLKFNISQVFWKSIWFWIGMLFFVMMMSYFIYKSQLKRIQLKARKERELISSKLTAIQSQMNPHFIFNSLNSIQDLVLNQQGENAYNYISKFAFLVRKVLHYSEVEFIQLEDELQVLMVYLELEQLRFDEDFEFHFDLDIEDEVEIPPMIIQPFVENAIKHGLLHKSGEKRLDLRFKLTEHLLLCEIEDNGIGRQQSKEINERKKRAHESFSTSSIQDRFEILRNIHGGELGVNYHDKIGADGPSGTIVRLQIPLRRSH